MLGVALGTRGLGLAPGTLVHERYHAASTSSVATVLAPKPPVKVQRNGFLSRSFHRAMKAIRWAASSWVERKLRRRRQRRASTPKKSSIWLTQEACSGV